MDARAAVLRAWEREPHRTFSTTSLVETIYPQQMRTVKEQINFGSKQQQKIGQHLKSKLHRNTLYHLNKLVADGTLQITRVDAHGEKNYALASQLPVHTPSGVIQFLQQPIRTHYIQNELDEKKVFLFEEQGALTRVDAFYLDATKVDGLGHLSRTIEGALRIVNDVVCVGDFQCMLQRYKIEDLEDFLNILTVNTLDEARAVCLLIDIRNTNVSEFIKLYAQTLPKKVQIIFVCDRKSILSKDFSRCIELLQERHQKINVHFSPNYESPLFIGRAGAYSIQPAYWEQYKKNGTTIGMIVSQASIAIDLKKTQKMAAHEVRELALKCAKALCSIASQQHTYGTAIHTLKQFNSNTEEFYKASNVYLRFWNYDWETTPEVLESSRQQLIQFAKLQETIYRACGLPIHFNVQVSSAFSKFHPTMSGRVYRKWMINSTAELESAQSKEYLRRRKTYLEQFQSVDRMRIFRAGSPTGEQVAKEIILVSNEGFPFITIDFKPLQGVRKLTEYIL
jgi:hypothetical protein